MPRGLFVLFVCSFGKKEVEPSESFGGEIGRNWKNRSKASLKSSAFFVEWIWGSSCCVIICFLRIYQYNYIYILNTCISLSIWERDCMIQEPNYLYTINIYILFLIYTHMHVYIYFIFMHIAMFTQQYGDTCTLRFFSHVNPRIMTPRDARSKQVVCGSPKLFWWCR